MNKILVAMGVGMALSVASAGIGATPDLQEIVVTARGVLVETPSGKSASGVPIVDMSVSYGVSYVGLDLSSAAGSAEIERRVNEAAKDACHEIGAKRPAQQFTTTELQCTKASVEKAMVRVRELVAEAAKRTPK